ncbi:Tat pathway signal protein [Pseudaestuariivita sp.]|uniref:Tat pathway signal protein n=1 Tax=Pseudaestuariivita sp. TaxID=2211669 RepID=UPI004057D8A8
MDRRSFLILSAGAVAGRTLAPVLPKLAQRRVLTLVYGKSIGAMRAIDKVVP